MQKVSRFGKLSAVFCGRDIRPVPKVVLLSVLSVLLLIVAPWWLGALVAGYHPGRFISELGALDMPGRSIANGVFLLTGAFWMGTVEAARQQLEPQRLDPWLRYGVIAFASASIAGVIFPCDLGCPVDGSVNQTLHNTLVWLLYAGGVVAGMRLSTGRRWADRLLKTLLLLSFLAMQLALLDRQWWPGLFQRGYELCFALLWLAWVYRRFVRA